MPRKEKETKQQRTRFVLFAWLGRVDSRPQGASDASQARSGLGSLVARHILRHRRASFHRVAPVGGGRLEGKRDVWITSQRSHVQIGWHRVPMAIEARRSAARTSAPIRRLSCSSGNSKKIRRSFNQELVATGSPDSAREPGRRGLTRSRWGSSPSARRWRPRRPGRSWPWIRRLRPSAMSRSTRRSSRVPVSAETNSAQGWTSGS